MSELSFMVTITNKVNADRFRRIYEQMGATRSFLSYGRGTASSRILNTFGLERSEKAIFHTVIDSANFPAIRRELERQLVIDVPGTGFVFLVPLSAVGGKKQLQYLLGSQEYLVGEETEMKHTEQELIVVIANQGYTEKIMDAARSAGAGGGTVLHAKGTGASRDRRFFGVNLADEKDMIYIVAYSDEKAAIMKAISEQAGPGTKAGAICFSLPISAVAGLRAREESILPEAAEQKKEEEKHDPAE